MFFEENGLIFHEIDLRNDAGKDVILDLGRSEKDLGLTVSLQIKGGDKYKRKSGHVIEINSRLRSLWLNSNTPIFVVAQDPNDGELYWGNLKEMAERAPQESKSAYLYPDQKLTPNGISDFLEAARTECKRQQGNLFLRLFGEDELEKQSALFDCLAVGRNDPRYFRLLRSLLLSFRDQNTYLSAVRILSHATPHPDIFWHNGNIVPTDVRRDIAKCFRWAPNEISMLISRLPKEEGIWERGTISQSLYMLLVEDPALDWSLDRLITESFRTDEMTWRSTWIAAEPFGPKWVNADRKQIIFAVLALMIFLADSPEARLEEIRERLPGIQKLAFFREIALLVEEYGGIGLF